MMKFLFLTCHCFVVQQLKPWSRAEKEAAEKHLGYLIKVRRAPRKLECLNAIQSEPALQNRDWQALKNHIASKVRYARLTDAKH